MKTRILGLVTLCFAHLALFGQDEAQIARFQRFFDERDQPALEESLHAATGVLEDAREIQDPLKTADALKTLGLLHLGRSHNYEKAMDLLIQALAIEDSLDLEPQRVLTYVAIARVFEVVGDYHKSAEFLELALTLNEDERDINSVAMILNNLGKVNAARGRIDDAFRNYERVLRYQEDVTKNFEAEALFNLGHLYTIQGHYAKALKTHKQALATIRSFGDQYFESRSLNDIGNLYGLMNNDEKSFRNHEVALEIRQRLADKQGMAESNNNMGWLLLKQNRPQEAIAKGVLALGNGRESQAQDQIFKSHELLSQSYKSLGDYENALTHKELSLAIHEFIQSEKQDRQLLETQNRYIVGKKESEIRRLDALRVDREKEIAAQNKLRDALSLLIILTVIIALLLFILYLVKRRSNRTLETAKNEVQKQNGRLQELNDTKDKFFSIISHDLKGPLNSLTSFSHLLIDHIDSMSKDEIQLLAKDLDKSVKNLFTLLENLLEWSRSQTGNIDFTGEVFNLKDLLESNRSLLGGQAKAKNISIQISGLSACYVSLHKQSINTVVRNLLSNAIKFTKEGGAINLNLTSTSQSVMVAVEDNGVGMTEDVINKLFRLDRKHSSKGTANEKGTGLGLILCQEFIEKNGGTLSVRSEPGRGSVFSFTFPLAVQAPSQVRTKEPVSFV